jgi:hypothetical protein
VQPPALQEAVAELDPERLRGAAVVGARPGLKAPLGHDDGLRFVQPVERGGPAPRVVALVARVDVPGVSGVRVVEGVVIDPLEVERPVVAGGEYHRLAAVLADRGDQLFEVRL